ncbi:MAG: phage holin family protein [Thermomicrobia bacterium]|nr:phage holin family protein [Thermomicrobia bacterium]MCA1724599.1 phage holin family protein [Thermomicrobia bacterium]
MQQSKDERSIGELFGDLVQQTGTLVRQEMKLATTELSDKASRVGKDIGALAVGGAVAYAGFLALLAAIIIGLGQLGLPWWIAALIVGVVVVAIGGLMVQKGLTALKHQDMMPQQTITSLKEDQTWAKEQI